MREDMAEPERERSSWVRWGLRLAAALAVVAILAAVATMVVHSPPVRRYALERAISSLEETARIRLHAADLTYNLFALRITLDDVRVASVSDPGEPFFVAERVSVALYGSLLGRATRNFALQANDRIDITHGRVRIARSDDGRLNLPEPAGSGTRREALELGAITAPAMRFDYADPTAGVALSLPSTDIALRGERGRIELREAGQLIRRGASTRIRELRGAVGFDGRSLALGELHGRFDEASLVVDGRIELFTQDPHVNLRVTGHGDVSRLARWADVSDPPHGDVHFEGTVEGPFDVVQADVRVRVPRLRWRQVTAANVTSSMRVSASALEVRQFDADGFGGRVTATGTVPLGNGETRAIVSWADIDVENLMRTFAAEMTPRPTGRAAGSLTAHGPGADLGRFTVDARTRTWGGVTAPDRVALSGTLALRLDNGRWRVRADERVDGIPVRATLHGLLDAERVERSTLAGTITIPQIGADAVLGLVRRTGVGQVNLSGVEGTVQSDITLSGSLGAPMLVATGVARIVDVAPLAPGTPLGGPATVEFEATRREARVRGVLEDFAASVRGAVDLRPPYEAAFDISAPSIDIERALRGIDTPVPLAGTASATAHVAGPLESWQRGRVTVELAALEVTAGSLCVRLASPARLDYADQVVTVPSLDLFAGETRFAASGALPLSADTATPHALQVTATGDLAQFTSAVAATGLVDVPDVSGTGPAALLARITGSMERPHVTADLELGPGTLRAADLPTATDVHVRAHSDGEWLDLRELRATWQGSRIDASGRLPLAIVGEPGIETAVTRPALEATLEARMTSITPQVLSPFVEPDTLAQIEGSVDAALRLQAKRLDLASLTGSVQLDRMDLRIADLPIAQRVPTRVTLENGFARVAQWEWAGQGGSVGIAGRVNLMNQQAALLARGRFDLRMLTPFVRDAGMIVAGTVEPRLSITGKLPDVRVDGDLSVGAGELRLADPRIVATDVSARAVVSRDAAQLTSLTGSLNGGTLSGTGHLAFSPRTPREATLSLTVNGMGLEFPAGLRSELNAALGVNMVVPAADIVQPTGSVTGTVTVMRSAYREPMAVVAGLLNGLRTRQLAGADMLDDPALVDNLVLDVRVLTEDDILVDNNLGRLQLGADLRVVGTVAAPSVAGRAQLREGGRLYFGRNIYVIEAGTIDFANAVTIEPDLNIRAHTRAGGEDIELTLRGTPDNLDTELDAPENPDLGEADLYSLLITGKTLAEVSGDEAEILGEQLLQYLSGDVLGLASRVVGLDTIRLGGVEEDVLRQDPTALATEVDPTTRLTFGKSFGRDLDVTYSQSLRDGDAQAWIIDYRPWPSIEGRFVSDDEDLRSYEVRHDVSIGGARLSSTADGEHTAERPREARVAGVTVRGSGPIPEARVLSALKVKTGEVFDFADWQRDRENLEQLYQAARYYEARIDAQRSESADGMALVYDIAPGLPTRIEVTGHRLDEDILNRLRTAWSQSVVDEFLLEEVRAILAADLARKGHLHARVAVALRLMPEAAAAADALEKTLLVTIDPGPAVRSFAVDVYAPEPAVEQQLAQLIRDRNLERAAASDPDLVQRELTTHLRANGYLQARVRIGAPALEVGRASVRIEANPGRRFTIADISFIGASRIATEALLSQSGLTAGMAFDPAAVDFARQRIVALYRREGFGRATVDVRQIPQVDTAAVAVGFAIEEGPRQVVAEIDVQGSRGVDTDVVTRALHLEMHQPLAADAWLQARRRVFETGLFRRVDVAAEQIGTAAPDADVQPMRIRVIVEPWPALRLRYGFQVSEQRPEGQVEGRELAPGLSADLTRRTVFGRAVTVGAAIDYERRERGGRAFVSAPTMFGWPLESLLVLERTRETFTAQTLTSDRSTLSVEERFRVTPDLRLSATYRLTRDHTFDTGEPDPIVGARDITVRVARLNVSAALDTRDDPVDSRHGLLFSSSFDYAPAALGSEFRYAKYLTQAYYFKPWRDIVFASAARVGVAAALDNQLLLLSERFTAGGAHSVRGAEEDGLGPRDFFGPTGGEAVLVLNQEARFPIYRWVRGVVFVDVGNVFERPSELRLGDLAGAAGFGVRFHTPFALLRVDYGRLFTSGPAAARSGRWMFGLGQAF
jgi:outer membrane protein assembly factor BamA